MMEDKKYIKLKPYVGEDAIYYPVRPYADKDSPIADYREVITKDLFVEAYNKWIKNATAQPSGIADLAQVRVFDCTTCNRHDASGNSKSVECLSCTSGTNMIPTHWVGKW